MTADPGTYDATPPRHEGNTMSTTEPSRIVRGDEFLRVSILMADRRRAELGDGLVEALMSDVRWSADRACREAGRVRDGEPVLTGESRSDLADDIVSINFVVATKAVQP